MRVNIYAEEMPDEPRLERYYGANATVIFLQQWNNAEPATLTFRQPWPHIIQMKGGGRCNDAAPTATAF